MAFLWGFITDIFGNILKDSDPVFYQAEEDIHFKFHIYLILLYLYFFQVQSQEYEGKDYSGFSYSFPKKKKKIQITVIEWIGVHDAIFST